MSDEGGERTCPLCAEEMDLTDQQLKPCKCGYEICVWCWHHIMDMAEKDDTEGRCPACRSAYDKQKIVGTAANCERLVAEMSWERKKSKAKPKSTDGRKQLSTVRVIQRNLVYIVGLPLDLADEDLLQHREYFGQYGKVLKVSMSRTAAGVIQQFPNNTCSVYITYSKEDEAVRCIQSVHGFVLEGKSLKACFGTTKYCHAWLRNVPCTNADCLYLHEVGSHEDSFTKDEIISAYTRNRVQQITGATNNLQRHAGSMLPPPVDDYCIDTSASADKPIVKSATSGMQNPTRSSPPNGTYARSTALPAAASWGTRASNQPLVGNLASSNGPCKQKPETVTNTLAFSTSETSTTQVSALHGNEGKKSTFKDESQDTHVKGKAETLKPLKQNAGVDFRTVVSKKPSATNGSDPAPSNHNEDENGMPSNVENNSYHTGKHSEEERHAATDGKMLELCSDVLSMSVDSGVRNEPSSGPLHKNSLADEGLIKLPGTQMLEQFLTEQSSEASYLPASAKTDSSLNGLYTPRELCDWRMDSRTHGAIDKSSELEDDILSFDSQRLKDPEVSGCSSYLPSSANSLHISSHSRSHSLQYSDLFSAANISNDLLLVDNKTGQSSFLHSSGRSILSNGYHGSYQNSENSCPLQYERRESHTDRLHGGSNGNVAVDSGENSIISNILSMEFDVWDNSAATQNFAKLFGESEKQPSSLKTSSSWKQHSNNQSRFSFARQEETRNQLSGVEQTLSIFGQLPKSHSFNSDLAENRNHSMENFGVGRTFASGNFDTSENFISNPSVLPSKRLSVSRSQMSAPPGFSIPNKAPPPGFSSHERADQAFVSSGSHMLDSYSLLRNSYQVPPTGSVISPGDIEFMDPAILAVGKGRFQGGINNNSGLDVRSNFPSQLNAFENEARLQLLMQRSPSPHPAQRIPDFGNSFSSNNDSYGNMAPFASQVSLQQRMNPYLSNGQWDGWNDVQNGNMLRNEQPGFNKLYSGYEDTKFRMPSSGDMYNRTFGM
ncbi:uncharacterized protein [Rutidosis leptorrhynchoides]|uniref:uncharacterized protein n=1 Tax=Rutidosis leptorrhynchoides TaxID=125765 RepID=UPI003A997029